MTAPGGQAQHHAHGVPTPPVLGTPASLIRSELSVYLAPAPIMAVGSRVPHIAFTRPSALPRFHAAGSFLCRIRPRTCSTVHKKHNTRLRELPAGGPGPIGVGLWASWEVLVRVAKSATPGVFGRDWNTGDRAAVCTIQVDIQYVRGRHHWPEGVLNDKGLRVAEMAGEQLLLLYHLS
jgi:hypothetical protein